MTLEEAIETAKPLIANGGRTATAIRLIIERGALVNAAAARAKRLEEALRFLETEDVGDGAFGKWMDELNEQVIQEEYGYEPGEFDASPFSWVFLFAKGLTPSEAFKRACDAHREARILEQMKEKP